MERYDITQPIEFKVGMHELNANPNLNYELNRLVNWDGGDLDELRRVSFGITDFADWKRVLLELGDAAMAEGRVQNAIGYYRMAEFYMDYNDPDALKYYTYARELFYDYYADYFTAAEGEEPIVQLLTVPYEDTELPVMHVVPEGERKGCLLVHGGYDSYYEEFLFPMLYLRERGYEVYLFEGPGQGEMLRLKNKPLIVDWERPVMAITAHFDLHDVTIVGISLGGYLAPRAAAFDKRITRVVSWGVFHSLLENVAANDGAVASAGFQLLGVPGLRDVALDQVRKKAAAGDMQAGVLVDALHKLGVDNFKDAMTWVRGASLTNVAKRIDQDLLVMGADADVLCSHLAVAREIRELTEVKSFTFRLITTKEQGGDHCNCGNTKLALDTICDWMASLDRRDA